MHHHRTPCTTNPALPLPADLIHELEAKVVVPMLRPEL